VTKSCESGEKEKQTETLFEGNTVNRFESLVFKSKKKEARKEEQKRNYNNRILCLAYWLLSKYSLTSSLEQPVNSPIFS
jgi:hypothetical protein